MKFNITVWIYYTSKEKYKNFKNYLKNLFNERWGSCVSLINNDYYDYFRYNNFLYPWATLPNWKENISIAWYIIDFFEVTTPYLEDLELDWTYLWIDTYTW